MTDLWARFVFGFLFLVLGGGLAILFGLVAHWGTGLPREVSRWLAMAFFLVFVGGLATLAGL